MKWQPQHTLSGSDRVPRRGVRTIRRRVLLGGAAAALAFGLVACETAPGTTAGEIASDNVAAPAPAERTFPLVAVQHAMDRHIDRTAFPDTLDLHPTITDSTGFALTPPGERGEEGMWRARAYAWNLSTIVVNEGDTVNLDIFGIHGDEHPAIIEGYDVAFTARRGQYSQVSFVADKPGVFAIICAPHSRTMVAHLVVLPTATA